MVNKNKTHPQKCHDCKTIFTVIKLSSTINVIILPNYPIGKLYLLEVKVKGYGV